MNSEYLIDLFTSFLNKNDEQFLSIAKQIIDEEKRKNHMLLAKKLNDIIEQTKQNNNNYSQHPPIPRDNEKGFRLLTISENYLNLDDIILSNETKKQIEQIILEWKKAEILYSYRLKPTQKILFYGLPGTGKTKTAQIISSILERPLVTINFESVVSSFLGETSSNLRKIFDFIEKGKWVVLFDEFDIIGKNRDDQTEHGEIKRVVNNFMLMLENYTGESLLIAATNHPHILDKGIWRRFEEKIYFKLPTKEERKKIFQKFLVIINKKEINYNLLATKTANYSGADIELICLKTIKNNILNGKDFLETSDILKTLKLNQIYLLKRDQ